jgi:hypothetical protein
MPIFRCAAFATLALLTGCAYQGPELAGQPGLQWQVISFYGDRAQERDATCNAPQMRSIVATEVVEDTPERLVLAIRYYWVDETQAVDMARGGSNIICRDWGARTFTFARAGDGGLTVQSMSGPQRRA